MATPAYPPIVKMYPVRIFQPGIGPRIVSALMSDLQAQDLSTQNIFCPQPGGPTALPAGFTHYLPGDICFDSTAAAASVCSVAGNNATSQWVPLGGGGGGAIQQFKIVSDGGDYWVANTWDGTNKGTQPYSIIKPYKLRCGGNAIQSETIRGVTYTYTYTASGGVYSRGVSGSDGTTETDYIIPDPLVNDIIFATSCSTTALPNLLVPALNASLVASGTGLAAGEVLTATAPTGAGGTPAQVTVNTVDGNGKILTFTLTQPGLYSQPVTNPVTFGGSQGTPSTFNLTLQQQLVDLNIDGRAWAAQ